MRVPDKFRLLQTVQLTSSFETYSSPVYWSSLDKQRLLLRISIYTSISHVFLLQMDRKRNEFDEISKQQRLLSSFWSEPRYERESETRFLRPREDVYRCISRGECMHASCLFARFFAEASTTVVVSKRTRISASLNLYCKQRHRLKFRSSSRQTRPFSFYLSLIFPLLLITEQSCDPLMNFVHSRWSCLESNNIFRSCAMICLMK